jgi:hypothetical protein
MRNLGSASVSLVGDGVLAIADFLKACCGETPQPTRETRALPSTFVPPAQERID